MAKTLEELGDLEVELVSIPVDKVDPVEGNPNEMGEAEFEALVEDLRRGGMLQPILVRPCGSHGKEGRWPLIDGENRWRAAAEAGYRSIPGVVDRSDPADARVRTLTMNRLRGQPVPYKLAQFLAGLAEVIPEDELRRRMAMDQGEFRDTLALVHFADPGETLRDQVEREQRDRPTVLSFVCNERDARTISRVVEGLTSDKVGSGQALAKVCREWTKRRKSS